MLMMRKFVSERLSAAVEEILGVVEHTVADYQTEVSRLKKEVCCLRSQLDLLQPEIKHVADIRHVAEPVSQEHVLPELYHCDQMPGPSLWQDPTPLRTKEEPQDLEPTELPEDPKPLLTKVEEEPFDISEGLEGDVIKLVLHPASAMSGFCPPLSPDFATAPSGNSDFSVKRKRGRPRRDDAGADPVRRQNYLERAAANQRQYRARRDTDPVKRQNYLEREKARWREARKTGKKKSRPSFSSPTPPHPKHGRPFQALPEVRFGPGNHWPQLSDVKNASRCRAAACARRTKYTCMECRLAVCPSCFASFHSR